MPQQTYQANVVRGLMDLPEAASQFRDVSHFGMEYRRNEGGSIYLGKVSEIGEFHAIAGFTGRGSFDTARAIEILKAEISNGFKADFRPNVALVIEGKVIEPGKAHRERLKPYNYSFTGKGLHCYDLSGDEIHGQQCDAIDLVVYNQDINQVDGFNLGRVTEKVYVSEVGRKVEEKLGLTFGEYITSQISTPDLYLSGKPRFQSIGSREQGYEFLPKNIAVLVKRGKDKSLTVASLNPELKPKLTEDVIKQVMDELKGK